MCSAPSVLIPSTIAPSMDPISEKTSRNASPVTQLEPQKSSAGFVTAICSIFAIVFLTVCWVFYAYTHPHTGSGQFLIQYGRPQAWSWRRGEARYTAATIHMWINTLRKLNFTILSSSHHYLYLAVQRIISRDVMTQRDCKLTEYSLWYVAALSLSQATSDFSSESPQPDVLLCNIRPTRDTVHDICHWTLLGFSLLLNQPFLLVDSGQWNITTWNIPIILERTRTMTDDW